MRKDGRILLLALLLTGAGWTSSTAWGQPAPAIGLGITPEPRLQVVATRAPVLSAETAGRLADLPFLEGDTFAAGTVIARIDCGPNEARLARALAQQERARRVVDSHSRLERSGGISALEVGVARADAAAAAAEVTLARQQVERCEMKVPFAGRVVERKAQALQQVTEGQPLIEVIDQESLELEFVAPSNWIAWLKAGHRFDARIDETGETVSATVLRLAPRIDAVSQTIKVYARADNGKYPLIAGMGGNALIHPPTATAGTAHR